MEAFLNTLFGDALADNCQVSIFTLPDKRTRHFADSASAAAYAQESCANQNVYFGVGLAGANFGHRNSSTDIVAIPGFWADIDMASPERADKPLPTSVEDVKLALLRMPLSPTMLVHSGFGLHAYWLFKEPWILTTDAERAKAAQLAKIWHGLVCSCAAAFGWKLENLGDLARVLRLPGTFNRKSNSPEPVRVIEEHLERRYNPCAFEDLLPNENDESDAPQQERNADVVLRANANPPAEKLSALLAASTAFAQSWNRQRTDLQDQSQSAYDQSLANIAALNQWSDQEIADLLIAARRRHAQKPEKALRADYVANTTANARKAAAERSAEGVNLSGFKMPETTTPPPSGPKTLRQLVQLYPELRPPVIEGLLREGETMNVISAPKIGKSWLVIDLALSIATGRQWLGMQCIPGDVLILDNELHGETSANRIPRVQKARQISFDDVADRVHVENLRGSLQDLFALGPYFRRFRPGKFKVVILDAFYRFLPMKADENDNGTMANLYNHLDLFADYLKCSFVLIHHTSKGNQSAKDVTDVGAGAGAQSRATDTHLVLRRHEEEDAVVMDAAVRSWSPIEPKCLRWAFPVWMPDDSLDPTMLKQEGKRRKDNDDADDPTPQRWTPEMFVQQFVAGQPRSEARIQEDAEQAGLSSRRVKRLLELAEEESRIFRWSIGQRKTLAWATTQQPLSEDDNSRAAVESLLRQSPDLSSREIADQCSVSVRYVQRLRREIEEAAQ